MRNTLPWWIAICLILSFGFALTVACGDDDDDDDDDDLFGGDDDDDDDLAGSGECNEETICAVAAECGVPEDECQYAVEYLLVSCSNPEDYLACVCDCGEDASDCDAGEACLTDCAFECY